MPESTCSASFVSFLISLSPALGGLLSAIALWVASRARTTSEDARQTSQAAMTLSLLQPVQSSDSSSAPDAPDRKRS